MVLVVPYQAVEPRPPKRLGFLQDQFAIPDDFDSMGQVEIEQMFSGKL